MPGIVEIQNLRNIRHLRFEVPDRGVWLLTAGNGAGKTSLLACLRRIGHPNAFPVHFASSLKSERLDNHAQGSVTYEINGDKVEYAYRGERWTPRPRTNSDLFSRLGYSSVMYIGANADRITPRPEDFAPRKVRNAAKFIIDAANRIFETKKFSNLKTINLTRGIGNDAFVLALDTKPITYHSEKHFSLGELCVLKLLRLLSSVNNNSMIIVDELEMALHPRAQVNLLRFLEEQAASKSLTVIFSTHSVTLLKAIDHRRIIFLESDAAGSVRAITGCFPTFAIGNIAADEESLPDIMVYVEDLFARDIVTSFYTMFADEKYNDPTERPTIKVIPVGGFQEVVSFLQRNHSVLPKYVHQKALLDHDVSSETITAWEASKNFGQLKKFDQSKGDIDFLPFTPEVGLMNYIHSNQTAFEQKLREKHGDNQIRINSVVSNYNVAHTGSTLRNNAKNTARELILYLSQKTQKSEDTIQQSLCDIFALLSWSGHRTAFMPLLARLTR